MNLYIKDLEKKKTIFVTTNATKNWQTSTNKTITSVHPPSEEIKIEHQQAEIIVSPFKKINGIDDDKKPPTLRDIKNIQRQNNYSNQILHTMSQQMNRIEDNTTHIITKISKAPGKELVENSNSHSTYTLGNSTPLYSQKYVKPFFEPFDIPKEEIIKFNNHNTILENISKKLSELSSSKSNISVLSNFTPITE